MRYLLEYALAWIVVKVVGALPRPLARMLGIGVARLFYLLRPRLRRVGWRNLELVFPERPPEERRKLLHEEFDSLGRLFAEFCLFPRYTKENVVEAAFCDGLENYLEARSRGRGVFYLTAHLGGWEIGSFATSLMGYPAHIVVRELDNPYLDRLVERYRTRHGNRIIRKQDSGRALLTAMRAGETVGLLMDTNITPPYGVFVPFFGIPACTADGLARLALRTGAAVVPAFTLWDDASGKYCIHFEPALELIATGDADADALANTAMFNRVIEQFVRRYPGQWLWVHRRWKTRPPGDPPIY